MSDNAAISAFISKLQVAKNYNSKEIRLTIEEADDLTAGITNILLREMELGQKVIDLQAQILKGIEVRQDGGLF